MATGFYSWSKTAASNATADSSVNWAEGQAPSSLNDSARAMMARLAEWRDDISGTLTTGGTSTAYTVTTNQAFASLSVLNTRVITIVPHVTCGTSPTLAVDGLTAQQIRTATGTNVPSGSLVAGTPYQVIYFSATAEFILVGFVNNPYVVPIGTILDYVGTTAPNSSFALCYGQAISRSTYATLFGITSTTFGTGDGSTTFNLPDCRGRIIAGWDSMGGSSANRLTGSVNSFDGDVFGNTGGAENITLDSTNVPAHTHTSPAVTDPGHGHTVNNGNGVVHSGAGGTMSGSNVAFQFPLPDLTLNNNTTGITLAANTGSSGGGGAHANVQPTIILAKIIRLI